MTTIEVVLEDGTVARWTTNNEFKVSYILDYIENEIGPPDTLLV